VGDLGDVGKVQIAQSLPQFVAVEKNIELLANKREIIQIPINQSNPTTIAYRTVDKNELIRRMTSCGRGI
jgi:hypothetical protein